MNSRKVLKVDKEKPKNFDDLVEVEKLRHVIKVNQERLSKSKSKGQIKKTSKLLKNKKEKLSLLLKKLGANKL